MSPLEVYDVVALGLECMFDFWNNSKIAKNTYLNIYVPTW